MSGAPGVNSWPPEARTGLGLGDIHRNRLNLRQFSNFEHAVFEHRISDSISNKFILLEAAQHSTGVRPLMQLLLQMSGSWIPRLEKL